MASLVTYKRKPLSECSDEELIKAAEWANKHIPMAIKEKESRSDMALLFCSVLPRKDHSETIKTTMDLDDEIDKLKYMAKQIKKEMTIRLRG